MHRALTRTRVSVYRARVRALLLTLVATLVSSCQAAPTPEPRPREREAETAPAHVLDTPAERKRACVEFGLHDADPRDHALIRSVCAEHVERDVPGVVLAIVEPDRPPFVLALGVGCFGDPTPVTADTRFRFGSISKTFTAALAAGLIADHQLSLDSQPGALVPRYANPAGLPEPTLASLLRHRSGLGEILPAHLVELDGDWLPALTRSPAAGESGSYHYSNAGYTLIGAMLSSASERDYAELLTERIATPLALASLTTNPNTATPAACGHLEHDRERHPIAVRDDLAFMPGDPRWLNPSGGVLGTATDLARFALALGTDALPGSAALLEPGEPLPPEHVHGTRTDERYGLGLRSWALDERTRVYGHSGNNLAFAAELLFVPGRRAIVLLANCGVGLPASVAAAERSLLSADY